jgi:hypothetical protein
MSAKIPAQSAKRVQNGPNSTHHSVKSVPHITDTQRSVLLKTKKFDLDFSVFKPKPAAFILLSAATGRKHPEKDIQKQHFELPELEKETYRATFELAAETGDSPDAMSVRRFREYLRPPYFLVKEMSVNQAANKPKRNVLVRMKEMFDDFKFDSSVVYIAGPASKNGGLVIESRDYGEEELTLGEVAAEWTKRVSKQKHLLIILETNYAGKWGKDLAALKVPDISVFGACREKEKARTTPIGGLFTHNLLKFLNKCQAENLMTVEPNPVFVGDYLRCKIYTNFYLSFNSWTEMMQVLKSDFMEITYENGRYVGYINKAQKSYWGQFIWTNGLFKDCVYSGEFVNGHLHGKGVMTYKTGRVFEGDFSDNAPDGYGEEVYENGDRYAGKYRRGFKCGSGVYIYSNGDVYKGEFADNKPNGRGVLTMKNGSVYEGEFKNGRCGGRGVFRYKNGDLYDGEWVNSLKHGQGIYKYANGDVYEGQFVNGVRHGQGKLETSNGEVYVGEWAMDTMSGAGEYKTEHSKTTGEWVRGNLTKQPTFFKKVGTGQVEAKLI